MSFDMAVDPKKPNYLTVRFWGSDTTQNRLVLFCEGKQIGYHHIGDIDLLDFGTENNQPGFNQRFYYVTTPLPLSLTRGKEKLHFEIRALGPIWSYGQTFAQYQKPMTEPTRGIYAVYTHTNGYFVPPADEVQGAAPNPPTRISPGPELLTTLKIRLNHTIDNLLNKRAPLNQMEVHTLARAYRIDWTDAYRNPLALTRIKEGGDDLFRRFHAHPELVTSEKDTYNPEWFGFGPFGQVVDWLSPNLNLDAQISDGAGGSLTRRSAYAEMFEASRDFLRTHRRWYTNQTMIVDMYAYLSNRGLRAIAPEKAFPETRMLDYLYQSIGLKPWLGSDGPGDVPNRMLGDSYFEVTQKGLTRELGYVGYYGEVLDWIANMYEATKGLGKFGDPKVLAQTIKIARARAAFRYPSLDQDGNRTMRIEGIVGWRDAHYPGDVVYGERFAWDGSALFLASQTHDKWSIGYAQQMLKDNQFYSSLADQMKMGGLRVDAGLIDVPDQIKAIESAPMSPERLPMSKGDFVWADEQDGVVAVKNGTDILYVSLYWRARAGINFLARVHLVRPTIDRISTVLEDVQFDPSGMFYTRPDNIDSLAQGSPFHDYGDLHSAHAGERLPIPKIPAGTSYKPGDESVYAGRGSFYTLRYGPYLIAMNMSEDKSYDLAPQPGVESGKNLSTGKTISLKAPLKLKPLSTVVLVLNAKD
jgi:hypothetical protein